MVNRVVVLVGEKDTTPDRIAWDEIGQVVTGIPQLYQVVKESQVDLVIVGDPRIQLKYPVAARIRRYNGLTEIWKLSRDELDTQPEDEFIDGCIVGDLGQDGIAEKVRNILEAKSLLTKYRIVGRSARMKHVARTIDRIAPTDVPVLIVGASGSGKELVARAIHNYSSRPDRPFVAVNCGALAEGVLESELFGHEKGAFTGSVTKREGLFHKADGGTIFLDEVGETPLEMQVKLLRVLEDGTYYPVGSSNAQKVNVRIIAATNRDLTEAIAERRFREDLYFRIGVVKITLPALFERKADILPILQYFWRDDPHRDYSESAFELLLKYDWPGNVRQLKNFSDRMAALKPRGRIEIDDVERFIEEQHSVGSNLPVRTGKTVEEAGQELIYRAILSLGNEIRLLRDLILSHVPSDLSDNELDATGDQVLTSETIEVMEKKMIEQVLQQTRGNRKEAAQILGIGERTLYRKLKNYKLN